MNKISRDCFSIILENLQCKDIDNLKKTNKQINIDVQQLSLIYKKNQIKEIWGNEIFQIIYNSINLHKQENYNIFLKKDMRIVKNVIEMFYKDLIFNNSLMKSKKFVDIYSLYFSLCIRDQNNKDVLFAHRKECILKMFKKEDIVFDNPKLKTLFDVSAYINRFHDFLGRRILYKEFISELSE